MLGEMRATLETLVEHRIASPHGPPGEPVGYAIRTAHIAVGIPPHGAQEPLLSNNKCRRCERNATTDFECMRS
eukprot:15438551-Alexandrium_andersonii.AAC.1